MRKLTRKTVAITAGTVLLLSGAGAAYAYWTTTGSGAGSATTAASLAAVTVTQNGTVTAMAPGSAIQDVNFTINNGATTKQYVTNVVTAFAGATYVAAAGSGTGSTWVNHGAGALAPGCTTASFTITQPIMGIDIAAGSTAFTQTGPQKAARITMLNLPSNQDDCKGTTIALSFTVS
jgi:hypothetical protein